jgi:hypothetical protein
MSAAPARSDVLDEYWLAAVPLVSDRNGIGGCRPRAFISKLPGVVGREGFSENVAKVSIRSSVGIAGMLSPPRTGRDGFIVMGLSSPFFFADRSSAFFRSRSSSAIALLIFMDTICFSRLLTLRSQKPVKPPSSRGM